MAGADNEVLYGSGLDLSGDSDVENRLDSDGKIYIGSSTGPPLATVPASSDNALNVVVGDGTIDFQIGTGLTGTFLQKSLNLSDLANKSISRTNLGVAIGSDVEAWSARLDEIAALAVTDGNFIVGDGVSWVAENGATARTSLGLGSIATQDSNSVTITGGSITGITDLAVSDGGTGASTFGDGYILLGSGSSAITALDVTAKGSLIVGDGTTDPVALAVGANGEVLTADSTEASGVKWASVAGSGDVTAASNITDNSIVRGDGGAKGVQDSGIIIDDTDNVSAVSSITMSDTGAYRTTTTTTDTALLQAYDVDGASYTTFLTLTAANTPTCDLSTSVTIGGNAIYYASGTDVPVTDGGTGASDAGTARTNLGVAIGSNVQAWDAGLDDIAALAVTDGNIIVGDGANWVAENGATARTSLGLGTIATQAANSVSITGGSITGITDLAVADGGTGASTFGDGYVLLGSGTGAITALDVTAKGSILVGDGTTDPVALAVGTDAYVLTADSGEASGIKWAAAAGGSSPLTTKGDVYTYSTADARLAVGSDSNSLVADSGETTGLRWSPDRRLQLISSVAASSDSTIEFTGLTDVNYLIVLEDLEFGDSFSDNRGITFRVSTDNGSNWDSGASDYRYTYSGVISGTGAQTGNDTAADQIETNISSSDTDDPERRTYGEIVIMNIGNSSRTTVIGGYGFGSESDISDFCGIRVTAQDENAVQMLTSAGSFVAGNIYLYQIIEG